MIKGNYEDFRKAIMMRESSGNYQCINTLGFLGAYQFGKPRLWDLGLSIDNWKPKNIDNIPPIVRVISKEYFLNTNQLQDEKFSIHVKRLSAIIQKKFPEAVEKYSLSGLIAGAHLKGIGGVIDFLDGKNNADAYGTEISSYIELFSEYDIAQS